MVPRDAASFIRAGLLLAALPLACATAPAAPEGDTEAATAGPKKETRTVCKYVKRTGSRLAREVCVEVPVEPDGPESLEQEISTERFKRILQQQGPVRAVGRGSGAGG